MESAVAERRSILAFSKNKIFEQLTEKNGFADVEALSIRECGDLIMTAADRKDARQDHRNFASTFGRLLAFVRNATSGSPDIYKECTEQILHMYLKVAAAPYRNQAVACTLHTFSKDHPIDRKCMEDLSRLTVNGKDSGMNQVPESILQLSVGGRLMGLYFADWKMMVPGAALSSAAVDPERTDAFMRANPLVARRCRAMITNMIRQGSDPTVLGRVLDRLGGPVSDSEYAVYQAEEYLPLSEDVKNYLQRVSPGVDSRAVCFLMGTNTDSRMVASPVFINTGTEMMKGLNPSFRQADRHLVLVPPVRNTSDIRGISCTFGPLSQNGLPSWIDYAAELDGILCHRIYASSFSTCRPSYFLDLAFQVPEGILAVYNYLTAESSAGSSPGLTEIQTCWNIYPEDPSETRIGLSSRQYKNRWEICQRRSRIERMEILNAAGDEVLGTIIPEKTPSAAPSNHTVFLSLDAACSLTVRLASPEGLEKTMDFNCRELLHPMTPVSNQEFEAAVERSTMQADASQTHIDSLQQTFRPSAAGNWSPLMVSSRVWLPNEDDLFDALRSYPGSMREAMNNLGVYNNMKELLTRSGLPASERQEIITVFKYYIGSLIMESVLPLAKMGYAPAYDNLKLLISYPENGSGEGITQQMKDILHGVISYVNENLTNENRFEEGSSVKLYSESEATAFWHQNHPPKKIFMGDNVAAGTPDIGHSTHDFALRVGGHLYMFSLPYGAHRITVSILAKIYDGKPEALLRCFGKDSSSALKEKALETLRKAMSGSSVRLQDRLGFTMTLSRLFADGGFCVTGDNADEDQFWVQELTEAKLNAAIPAYARTIVQAIKDGSLKLDDEIYLAPVGNGSLAFLNTAPGFAMRFMIRLIQEINYLLAGESFFPEGTCFTGCIELLENNDTNKLSVAQGMIDIENSSENRQKAVPVPVPDLTMHYLDLIYDDGSQAAQKAKEQFLGQLAELDHPGRKLARNSMKTDLYRRAFDSLIDAYTLEDFTEAFDRFGYTGIDQGIPENMQGLLDESVREMVRKNFRNLCAQVKKEGRDLIMSCPFVEKEMICSALVDLAIDRLDLAAINAERK